MVRGYIPPRGPQNVHGVPHNYASGGGSHRIGDKVVYSPEAIILTSNQDLIRSLEVYDLKEVPEDVAEDALAAYQKDQETTPEDVVEAWEDGLSVEVESPVPEPEDEEDDEQDLETLRESRENQDPTPNQGEGQDLQEGNPSEGQALSDLPEDQEPEETTEQYEEGEPGEHTHDAQESAEEIPEDLDSVPYRGTADKTLQTLAQVHGVAANQSADDIREALAEKREE